MQTFYFFNRYYVNAEYSYLFAIEEIRILYKIVIIQLTQDDQEETLKRMKNLLSWKSIKEKEKIKKLLEKYE